MTSAMHVFSSTTGVVGSPPKPVVTYKKSSLLVIISGSMKSDAYTCPQRDPLKELPEIPAPEDVEDGLANALAK